MVEAIVVFSVFAVGVYVGRRSVKNESDGTGSGRGGDASDNKEV